MTLAIRRYLYMFFISAFVVITTVVITYANGYSLFSGSKILVKTGMLILDTEPQGAKVILNNKTQQKFLSFSGDNIVTTPAKIKNLVPGEYTVQLELPGYNTWQKKLIVNPGQATFAETVILFSKGKPARISEDNVKDFELSPDRKLIAIASQDKTQVINANNNDVLYQRASTSAVLRWSNDSRYLLLDQGQVLNLENQANVAYINIDTKANSAEWIDNNRLGYIDKNQLRIYDLNDKSSRILEAGEASKTVFADFSSDGTNLFTVVNSLQGADLVIYSLSNLEANQRIKLPGTGYQIIDLHNKLVSLANKKTSNLIIINPSDSQPLVAKINNFKGIAWADKNNIYYSTDHELYSYNLNQNKSQILARISQTINNLYLHPSNNYLLFTTDTSISSLELDNRDHHIINALVGSDNLAKVEFDDSSLQFYYLEKAGSLSIFYRFLTK